MSDLFYVYEHWRPDRDECFYVGKGKGVRCNNMRDRNPHHKAIQAKLLRLGMGVEVRIVDSGLEQELAFALEKQRIAMWRADGADLTNKTDGGQGGPTYTGRKHALDSIEKMRNSSTGKRHTPETLAKIAKAGMGRKHTDETKRKMGLNNQGGRLSFLGKKHTPETIEKMRETHRKNWAIRKQKLLLIKEGRLH